MQSLRDKVDKVGVEGVSGDKVCVEDVGVIFVMWSLLQGEVSGPGGLEGINACQGHTQVTPRSHPVHLIDLSCTAREV